MILPYDFSLDDSDGAWISSTGEIIKVYNTHETYAKNYCLGLNYDYLYKLKYKLSMPKFIRWQSQSGFEGNREDINEFLGSSLNKEELELLKKWMQEFKYCGHIYSDFLISEKQFSKAQIITEKSITTTDANPYITFWNYYLMGWDIDQISTIYYDKSNNRFDFLDRSFFSSKENDFAKDELDEIKIKVKREDRLKYLK